MIIKCAEGGANQIRPKYEPPPCRFFSNINLHKKSFTHARNKNQARIRNLYYELEAQLTLLFNLRNNHYENGMRT